MCRIQIRPNKVNWYTVSVTIDTNLSFFTKYVLKSLDSTSQNMLSFVNILEKI